MSDLARSPMRLFGFVLAGCLLLLVIWALDPVTVRETVTASAADTPRGEPPSERHAPVVRESETEVAPVDTVQPTRVAAEATVPHPSAKKSKGPEIAALIGFVRDASTQAPLADAEIFVGFETGSLDLRRVRSGADGSYRIRPLQVGRRYRAVLEHGRLRSEVIDIEGLPPGETSRDLLLDRSGALRVLVLDFETRQPVADVVVKAVPRRGAERWATEFTLRTGEEHPVGAKWKGPAETSSGTGKDGLALFSRKAFANAPRWSFLAKRGGLFGSAFEIDSTAIRGGTEIVLYCGKYVALSGQVVDARRQPLAHVRVKGRSRLGSDDFVIARDTPKPNRVRFTVEHFDEDLELVSERMRGSLTDELGRFRIDNVVRGIVCGFDLVLPGGERVMVPWIDQPGTGPVDGIEIRIDNAVRRLEGRITVNGEPVRGSVEWRGATSSGRALADENGCYRITAIEPGSVEITAFGARTSQSEKRKVEVPARGVASESFDFEAKPLVRGWVRDQGGNALSGVTVVAARLTPHPADSSDAVAGEDEADEDLAMDFDFFEFAGADETVEAKTTTGADGSFEFGLIDTAATYSIQVADPRFFGQVWTSAGDEQVEILAFKIRADSLEADSNAPPVKTKVYR